MALTLGACVVAFLLIELTLRIYNPLGSRVKGDRIILPANEVYSFSNNGIPSLDKNISHRKNALGFRNDELPVAPDKQLTIITVGGSTTECFYLSPTVKPGRINSLSI